MHDRRRIIAPIILIVILATAAIWYFTTQKETSTDGLLQASGTVEAVEVVVASEIAGRVAEVLAGKGDRVAAGDVLLLLDDELLLAQRQRAATGLGAAQANVVTMQTGIESARAALESAAAARETAQVQYLLALRSAQLSDSSARSTDWQQPSPGDFDQPGWYFQKSEELTAAQAELTAATEALTQAQADLAAATAAAGGQALQQAESRLAVARTAYQTAQAVLTRSKLQNYQALRDAAQARFDAAERELTDAQSAYTELLNEEQANQVEAARALVAAAQERQATAQDQLNLLLTGNESLQVAAVIATVNQAEAGLKQAETNLAQAQARLEQAVAAVQQAQAELDLVDVQIEKAVIYAPSSGVLLSHSVQPGEVIQPGAPLMRLGQLDDLTITVYVPEDRYGQISLGQQALVQIDSFPGETFLATVIHIADKAEFTPRNVQTAEGRKTTVFAVELAIDNVAGKLKPGMPADVTFSDAHQ